MVGDGLDWVWVSRYGLELGGKYAHGWGIGIDCSLSWWWHGLRTTASYFKIFQ